MTAAHALPDPSLPLPPALRELLALFDGELAELRFPGVDRAILRDLAAEADADEARIRALQSELEAAEAARVASQERLLRAATLGLAYARVYASDDEALLARLAAIALTPEPPRRRKLELAGSDGAPRLPPRRARRPRADDDARGDGPAGTIRG